MWMWMNLEHSGWNGPNFQVASGVVPPLAWLGSLSSSNLMGREEKEGEEQILCRITVKGQVHFQVKAWLHVLILLLCY